MRIEDERESDNVEDMRGVSGGGFPIGGRGLSIGGVLVVLVASYFLGVDPSMLLSTLQGGSTTTQVPVSYVIAHEVGHHIQNLLGIARQVETKRGRVSQEVYNALSVRLELQADCFAGVWANRTDRTKHFLDPGDIEEAINAATAIGDDTLQKQSQGYVVPDSFTHGTSAQRVRWLKRGLETGKINACDTFQARQL